MLLNIKTGYGGVSKTTMSDIAILITSLHKLQTEGVKFVFTDRHAYLQAAKYFDDVEDLDCIDWVRLSNRDFKKDPDDPAKFERYQAEALIHKMLPASALQGMACYGTAQQESLQELADGIALPIRILSRPTWYF